MYVFPTYSTVQNIPTTYKLESLYSTWLVFYTGETKSWALAYRAYKYSGNLQHKEYCI